MITHKLGKSLSIQGIESIQKSHRVYAEVLQSLSIFRDRVYAEVLQSLSIFRDRVYAECYRVY